MKVQHHLGRPDWNASDQRPEQIVLDLIVESEPFTFLHRAQVEFAPHPVTRECVEVTVQAPAK